MKAQATSSRQFVQFTAEQPTSRTQRERRDREIARSDGRIVVTWLNASNGAARRSVLAVMRELQELAGMMDEITAPAPKQDLVQIANRARRREEFRQKHNALNRRLSRFAHVPALAYRLDDGLWHFGMVPKRRRGRVVWIDDSFLVRIDEAAVVAGLARLATKRALHKVKVCDNCHKRWLFSLRAIDKCCSDECRKESYSRSDKGKRNHREAQRKYRNSPGYKRGRVRR